MKLRAIALVSVALFACIEQGGPHPICDDVSYARSTCYQNDDDYTMRGEEGAHWPTLPQGFTFAANVPDDVRRRFEHAGIWWNTFSRIELFDRDIKNGAIVIEMRELDGENAAIDLQWDDDTCTLRSAKLLIEPVVLPAEEFGIAVHMLGHAMDLRHDGGPEENEEAHVTDPMSCQEVCADWESCAIGWHRLQLFHHFVNAGGDPWGGR